MFMVGGPCAVAQYDIRTGTGDNPMEFAAGDVARARQAGEMVRAAIQDLGMPRAAALYAAKHRGRNAVAEHWAAAMKMAG
jgi:hypothetical protein